MAQEKQTRVGIYARVSTSDKDQDPESQVLPLREFVQAQAWQVVGEFVETAGATDLRGRVAWRELPDLASRRRVDVILCWKLGRCFRSTLHAAETLEKLRGWGVGLRSYTEPWADSTNAAGELMLTIATAFAAFERALIRERVRSGMERAKKQGTHVGRPRKVNGEWDGVRRRLEQGELTRLEAAQALGVSRATVYRLLSQKGSESGVRKAVHSKGFPSRNGVSARRSFCDTGEHETRGHHRRSDLGDPRASPGWRSLSHPITRLRPFLDGFLMETLIP